MKGLFQVEPLRYLLSKDFMPAKLGVENVIEILSDIVRHLFAEVLDCLTRNLFGIGGDLQGTKLGILQLRARSWRANTHSCVAGNQILS